MSTIEFILILSIVALPVAHALWRWLRGQTDAQIRARAVKAMRRGDDLFEVRCFDGERVVLERCAPCRPPFVTRDYRVSLQRIGGYTSATCLPRSELEDALDDLCALAVL